MVNSNGAGVVLSLVVGAVIVWALWPKPSEPTPQVNNSPLTDLDEQGLPLQPLQVFANPDQFLVTQDVPGSSISEYLQPW
jgi:hypothetical protein